MSSEIVTGRGVQILLRCAVCYVAQHTRAVLAETFLDPPRVAFLVASNLAKAGASLETEGHEKHNGNREHEYKAEDDEGERRGGGHGRKV